MSITTSPIQDPPLTREDHVDYVIWSLSSDMDELERSQWILTHTQKVDLAAVKIRIKEMLRQA